MEKNLCEVDGRPTSRYAHYLTARARSGVGMMLLEASYVDPVGKGRMFQLGVHSDHVIPDLADLIASVHELDTKVSLELCHAGRASNVRVTQRRPSAPSPVACDPTGGYVPHQLLPSEIREIVVRFGQAARRCKQAGCDAIQIHGASGYLVNAFLSPFSNRRTDRYGGSSERRMRFPLEVVEAVRTAVGPGFPLLYRLSAHEYVDRGLTLEETVPFAMQLEEAGIDLIDVTAGIYESVIQSIPPMELPTACHVDLAKAVKRAVSVPVSVAGRINSPEVAEQVLRDHGLDFVTIGRALHADPDFVIKAQEDRSNEIRPCIACSDCSAFLAQDSAAFCAVNPQAARESILLLGRTDHRRSVLVAGAGPAGLEAARAANLRGHKVVVYEMGRHVGGQARLAAKIGGRSAMASYVGYMERELKRLHVPVILGTEVSVDLVAAEAPDVLIAATGCKWSAPDWLIDGNRPVFSVAELLDPPPPTNSRAAGSILYQFEAPPHPLRVVVLGASWAGCQAADFLLSCGNLVTIVESGTTLAYDIGARSAMLLMERILADPNLHILKHCTIETFRGGTLGVWHAPNGGIENVEVDAIILAERPGANDGLAQSLAAARLPLQVHSVGDCAQPGRLYQAIYAGAAVGAQL